MWYSRLLKTASPLVEDGKHIDYFSIGHSDSDVILYFITKTFKIFKTKGTSISKLPHLIAHRNWGMFQKAADSGNMLCSGRYEQKRDICSCYFNESGTNEMTKREVLKILDNTFSSPEIRFYGI